MRAQAAVVEERGGPFVVQDVELDDPRDDEVLVRVAASGICQTDLHVVDGDYPVPLPVVAGHEGAGVVEGVGRAVSSVAPGDRVILSYPWCGRCRSCLTAAYPYCEHGYALSFGGQRLDGSSSLHRAGGRGERVNGHIFQQSSFATYAIATERNTVRVPDRHAQLPLRSLGPLGCSVQTGAGTVLNALSLGPTDSLAVIGTGSVGLAAVMAASAAGVRVLAAVDVDPDRLRLAESLGASHTVDARTQDVAESLLRIRPRGFDAVVELTARPQMTGVALRCVAMTGTAALVGGAPAGTEAGIDMNTLLNGRRLRGIIQGDAVSATFLPALLDLHADGLLPFDRLLRYYPFTDINEAVADMRAGACIKPVLQM